MLEGHRPVGKVKIRSQNSDRTSVSISWEASEWGMSCACTVKASKDSNSPKKKSKKVVKLTHEMKMSPLSTFISPVVCVHHMAWLVVCLCDPSAKLLRVGYRRREKDEAHFVWQQNDAFLPDDASVLVPVRPRSS